MVMIRSLCLAASADEAAATAPALTAAARAAGATSWATTAKPFFTRLTTIGSPMVPVPMKPTFIGVSFVAGERAISSGPVSAPSSRLRLRGLALICLAAISWGTTGSVTAVLVSGAGASPFVIGAVRMLIAAVLLLAGARWLTGTLHIDPADRWRCVALGACMAAYQVTYFSAVTMTGIAVAALIAICCAPLIIALLAASMLGERITAGVALALALGKATLNRTAPLPLAGANFGVAALVLAPLLAQPDAARQVALGWPWLLYLGAVATAGAYAIYTIGLREVPASVAGIATLVEPLTATLLGVGLFGERLGAAGALG